MTWLKSIGAVVAGLMVIGAGSTLTDSVLQKLGVFPPFAGVAFATKLLLIAFAQRAAWAVVASWVTARLAPRAPMGHALALGAIGVVLNIAGAIAMWSAGAHWYPFALAAVSLPCAWAGAMLAGGRRKAVAAS